MADVVLYYFFTLKMIISAKFYQFCLVLYNHCTLNNGQQTTINYKIRMTTSVENLIKKAYTAFNDRDIDTALSTMQPAVQWSKAWKGGYIKGHQEIREYWTRQWQEINPKVTPIGFTERANENLEVLVHQQVKDLAGNAVFDGNVKHIYTFENGLISTMDIELVSNP